MTNLTGTEEGIEKQNCCDSCTPDLLVTSTMNGDSSKVWGHAIRARAELLAWDGAVPGY